MTPAGNLGEPRDPRGYSCDEVADLLRRQAGTIRGWCRSGRIAAVNVGTHERPRYLIEPLVLADVMKHPPTQWGTATVSPSRDAEREELRTRVRDLERQLAKALADRSKWEQAARGADSAAMGYRHAFVQIAGPGDLDSLADSATGLS